MFSVLSYHLSTLFMKVYEDVTVQDGEFLALFGDFCRGAEQLPRSVSLSAGLTKSDNDTKTSTELMDVWQGKHQGARVAIKVFRAHRSRDLGAINGVRVEMGKIRFADSNSSTCGNEGQRGKSSRIQISRLFTE